jgi:hypothetical protein
MHDKEFKVLNINMSMPFYVFSESNNQEFYIWAICYYNIVVHIVWFINNFS